MADYTRRGVLFGVGSVAAAGTLAAVGARPGRRGTDEGVSEPPALTDGETDAAYPLVAYNDHGGPYRPTMPVNVRFDLEGTGLDASDVERVLHESSGWTRLLGRLDEAWPFGSIDRPRAWDAAGATLVEPLASYRYPVSPFGPTVGYHVHLWPVRVEGRLVGIGASTHTDVGNARNHLGARYDEAADRLSAPFLERGWTLGPATFEFGVEPDQRQHWGPTGDRWLRPPPVA